MNGWVNIYSVFEKYLSLLELEFEDDNYHIEITQTSPDKPEVEEDFTDIDTHRILSFGGLLLINYKYTRKNAQVDHA